MHGDEQALGQHLPDQPDARRAERRANRQLLGAKRRPRELHVHHVDARDQQHADAEPQHRPERAAQRPRREGLEQRLHLAGVELLVGVGIGGREPPRDRRRLGVRLIERDARLQQAEHRRVVRRRVVALARRELAEERNPELLVGREREALRHHADDGGGLAVQAEALADDVRRAAEVALPQRVADDRHLGGVRADCPPP